MHINELFIQLLINRRKYLKNRSIPSVLYVVHMQLDSTMMFFLAVHAKCSFTEMHINIQFVRMIYRFFCSSSSFLGNIKMSQRGKSMFSFTWRTSKVYSMSVSTVLFSWNEKRFSHGQSKITIEKETTWRDAKHFIEYRSSFWNNERNRSSKHSPYVFLFSSIDLDS